MRRDFAERTKQPMVFNGTVLDAVRMCGVVTGGIGVGALAEREWKTSLVVRLQRHSGTHKWVFWQVLAQLREFSRFYTKFTQLGELRGRLYKNKIYWSGIAFFWAHCGATRTLDVSVPTGNVCVSSFIFPSLFERVCK